MMIDNWHTGLAAEYVLAETNVTPGSTVNSRYSGHPRDRDLVSVIAGCEKFFILNHIYRKRSHVCSFSLTPVPF